MLYLIATGDYTGTSENHLSFTKGARIEFIERTEGGFIKGKLNGKVGILPSSLITIETRPLSIMTPTSPPPPPQTTTVSSGGATTPTTTAGNSNVNSISGSGDGTSVSSSPTIGPNNTSNNNNSSSTDHGENNNSNSSIVQNNNSNSNDVSINNDFDEDDDSTDSEDEGKINSHPTTTTTTTTTTSTSKENGVNPLTGEVSKLSLSESTGSFNNVTLTASNDEARKEKKKKINHVGSTIGVEVDGLFRKSKSNSKKRRYANRKYLPNITVSTFDDLPVEIKNDMQYEDVSLDEIKANFKIFLVVVKFITRQRFTYVHPDEDNMTITTTNTTIGEDGLVYTTTVVTTTKTINNQDQSVAQKERVREEIKTSTYDTDAFDIDTTLDDKDRKAKHVELKLDRKRQLTGTTAEFLGQASTTIKVVSDVKKKVKFGDLVGKGAFGKIYEAQYEKKKVAIKVVPYSNPKEQHAVLTEIGFLSKCKHPNILQYKHSVLYNSDLFLITEFLQGGTLEQAVASPHVWKESQIGYIGKEILKAIEYLHDRKLIHRDLKSANIMITVNGEIKIIDFGLCASVEKGSQHHMVGSPYWMAPEMVRGENISYPCDIWSFGICMLELLNKKPPHRESRLKAMFTNTTKGIDFSKVKCSLDLKDMLWQCFYLNPDKRSSANKLLRHPFFKRSESKSGMKGIFDNMFMQKNLNTTGFF
ncbi:putative protein serine/threonine kinase [Tieghemostelium lacteum]|uniref:Protein kinase domain-containing protein n=1 Tax=Tieghemostelium lacteum TaxID=361077 RepID=A0A151ZS14_TIELA|nr:putative protein serine/threonine kinase [Tieghemostelium lacteum]|eukprot:KYQ96811.1 putative protein serine/threonine kinase [Tieghemostelium lacteum]